MRSTHRIPIRITLLLAGVVAAGVLPAVSASAADPPPVVTYVAYTQDDSNGRLFANDPAGSGTPVALSPDVHIYYYDVSEDGNTVVAGVTTRDYSSDGMDTSWGVVLVSRTAGTTHLIGTNFDSPVRISADGRMAYWLSDGKMIRSVDGATGTPMATPDFAALTGEYASAIAISPDGTRGAALFRGTDTRRIKTAVLDSPVGGGLARLYDTYSTPYPLGSTFVWLDDQRLLYGMGSATSIDDNEMWDVVNGGTTQTPLHSAYDVSKLGSLWYAWQDTDTVTGMGAISDVTIPINVWAPRADGTSTYRYDVTTTNPPVMGTADNRTTGYLVFAFTKSAVLYGQRAVYASRVEYNIEYAPVDYAYWNCRGTLQYSIDRAVTWRPLRTTSCATLAPWPGGYLYHSNGYTHVLTRNTWFRWSYPGDALTMPASSVTRVVTVTPTLTVKIARSGSTRKVYGAATRIGGTAYLQKWSPTKRVWVRVATTRLTSRGAYSFGYRVLGRGSYRVWVLKDYYWNAAIKRFTI